LDAGVQSSEIRRTAAETRPSREIVTHYMNQFRRQGYLKYSRKGIILYREAFRDWLRQDA